MGINKASLIHVFFFFLHSFLPEPPTPNGPESQPSGEDDGAEKEEEGSEDEWEQVGPRNKTSVTRQADFVRTPITDIFGGHIRYMNKLRSFSNDSKSVAWICSIHVGFHLHSGWVLQIALASPAFTLNPP